MSIYVKTSAGADRMTMFEEVQNSSNIQRFKIGPISYIYGCKIYTVPKGREWFKLFDLTELQQAFGPGFDIERIHIETFNADSYAFAAHFYSPEIYYSGDSSVYQYFYPATTGQLLARVNYALYYYNKHNNLT